MGLWCSKLYSSQCWSIDFLIIKHISSTTFYCDGVWNDNVGEMAIIFGGDTGDVDSVGIYSMFSWSVYEWCAGASISVYCHLPHFIVMHFGQIIVEQEMHYVLGQ